MSQVLARKWRPKNFSELVGQEAVSQALRYALNEQRLHHAYLLTGTRGVGKTTIARILAKSLNCIEKGISAEPCGQCNHCLEIDAGRFPDLIEIDAASRTGVDDTREILENVPYAPAKGRKKVYLIDEVHMFSRSSFNALLKTLEEPPEHVVFILATTDPQKLPVTVVSRCLQFHLKNMSEGDIVRHLEGIAQQEALPYEQDALRIIAQAAQGSMRDALSLMDQLLIFGQGRLHSEDASRLLGIAPIFQIQQLLQHLSDYNAQALRQQLDALAAFAPDYALLLQQLQSQIQMMVIVQLQAQLPHETMDPMIVQLAEALSPELLQLWYQILSDTWQSLPHQANAQQCVEMGLLRMLAFRPILPTTPPQHLNPIREALPQTPSPQALPSEVNTAAQELNINPAPEQALRDQQRFEAHPQIQALRHHLDVHIEDVRPLNDA